MAKGRYVVKLKPRYWRRRQEYLPRSLSQRVIRQFDLIPYLVVELEPEEMEDLKRWRGIEEIFADGEVTTQEQQIPWGVAVLAAPQAAEQLGVRGQGVRVGVLDTGIDYQHPDLQVAGGVAVVGDSFADDNGHGTHVAGIIAARDNDTGIVGIAPEAELFAIKVLNSAGSGWYSDIVAGLEWAVRNRLDIVNLSLGGPQDNPLLRLGIRLAARAGLLLVAAAGNAGNKDGGGNTVLYPARYPEVIAVGAIDRQWQRAPFSSTGSGLELVAPGVEIMSAKPGGDYQVLSGTSMACPHITGLAALLKSANPRWKAKEIRKRLVAAAIDLGKRGWDSWYGYGLPNTMQALGRRRKPR